MISSKQNPRIKALLALQQKSSERRRSGLFVVEGQRELGHCIAAGYEVVEWYVCSSLLGAAGERLLSEAKAATVYELSPTLYEHIAYRGSTEGVVAVVKERPLDLNDLQMREAPLIVVLESVEKPGNLGAILRSADAAGADAVVVCDPLTDLYNPNLIRSSIMRVGTAIVMGTEATGLTEQWRRAATAHIRIPMLGRLDSLNVSVSSAILVYEAVRQRGGGRG